MYRQLGNIPADQTIRFLFPTANANGASVAPSPSGTVTVYKDNDPALKTVTGVSYSESFDSVVGLNRVVIDTSGEFFAAGHDYTVVLTGAVLPATSHTTLGGGTAVSGPAININTILADFFIENRYVATTGGVEITTEGTNISS